MSTDSLQLAGCLPGDSYQDSRNLLCVNVISPFGLKAFVCARSKSSNRVVLKGYFCTRAKMLQTKMGRQKQKRQTKLNRERIR